LGDIVAAQADAQPSQADIARHMPPAPPIEMVNRSIFVLFCFVLFLSSHACNNESRSMKLVMAKLHMARATYFFFKKKTKYIFVCGQSLTFALHDHTTTRPHDHTSAYRRYMLTACESSAVMQVYAPLEYYVSDEKPKSLDVAASDSSDVAPADTKRPRKRQLVTPIRAIIASRRLSIDVRMLL
jgi:hypothetical protein